MEDFGRGCPVDWNEKEQRYNWELVFCEMYAGGKYGENGENYEYSYLLENYNTSWTELQKDNEVVFTKLPYGNYVLKVRYKNDVFDSDAKEYFLSLIHI